MGLNKDKIINTVLGILIILSFILSFTLWTTGRNVGEEQSTSEENPSSKLSLTSYSSEDVFRPKTIALHGITQEEPLLVANSYELRDLFKENMEMSNLSEIDQVDSLTKNEYLERIQTGEWVEFIYAEELPFGVIAQKFAEISQDNSNLFFDRVALDLNNSNSLYFYHTESDALYNATLLDYEEINLDLLLDNDKLSYISAEPIFLKDQIRYLPTESLEMFYRTYVIHQLPNSSYISNFFPDTSLVDVRSSSDNTRYIDLTKEVTINEKNHTLTYLSQLYTSNEISPEERYNKSFEKINQFENWSDTLMFSSYNKENKVLSFRREIEGISVYSNNEYESISEVSLVEDGLTHLRIPLRFANTPINIKGSPTKVLVSGIEMMDQLRTELTEEEYEKIEDFNVGYSWEESDEESQVVNFNPNWYILYDNRWLTLSSLLAVNKETVYGF